MKPLAEAYRSALAQPVGSAVVGLIVAGVCAVILSTTGQTVKAEHDVLARIDDAGTRSIVITDTDGTGHVGSAAVDRIATLQGVEWVLGLGAAVDVRTVGNPGGDPAAMRILYGSIPPLLDTSARPEPGQAIVGDRAQQTLGMLTPYGGVVADTDYPVVGGFTAQDPLGFLNTGLLLEPSGQGQVRSIHILVDSPELVAPVTIASLSLLAAEDRTAISVETSQQLADIRAAVQGELGTYGRQIITATLIAGLVLTGLAVYGSVSSRRKDFGRRRALGATRPYIVGLVSLQTAIAAAAGSVLGVVATGVVLTSQLETPPDVQFAVAIGFLAIISGLVAAVPPAIVAAYRDPIKVLRIP
ncbi:MAG: FtsX-like permease family protein [Acidimicrobiia bacterium]